jgi:protein LSM14
MDEAARQAKEAVAAAMAKLNPQASQTQAPTPGFAAVDALSRKVSELSTSSSNAPQRGGRGNFRGTRGSYPRGGARQRMEIPKSDFDFESANAKFNKEDMIKEAIATGSPPVPGAEDHTSENVETDGIESTTPKRKDSLSVSAVPSYNKTSSFFDNISSEAKDREESQEARAQGRQFRGEEYKKNMETFGQGNVDSGFRGRGRGRGRGYGGGYGRGGYRARGRGGIAAPGQVAEQPQS